MTLLRLPPMRRLLVTTFLGFTGFSLTLAALPVWAAGSVSAVSAGLVTTAMLAATVALQLFVPGLARRWGTGRTLGLGLLLLGGPAPLYLVTDGLPGLVAVSAVRGAGFAMITVLGATTAAAVAPVERRGEALGLYGVAIAIPNLVAVPLGAALTLAGRFPVVAVAAAAPLLALPLLRRHGFPEDFPGGSPDGSPGGSPGGDGPRRGPRGRVTGPVPPALMLLVVTAAGGALTSFLPIERPAGAVAVVALAVYGVAATLARFGVGVAADAVGTRLLLPAALIAAALGTAGVAVGLRTSDVLVLAAALVLGAGYGATQNLTLFVAFARSPDGPRASAVWNLCFDAGTALGGAAGLLAATGIGIPGAYLVGALLVALAVVPALRLPTAPAR